jgi:hypothetical protein
MASISLKYKSKQGNLTAPGDVDPGAMIPLATTTLTTTTATVTFSSIPQVYEHLQVRLWGYNTSGSDRSLEYKFNNDATAVYANHYLLGSGAAASAGAQTGRNYCYTFDADSVQRGFNGDSTKASTFLIDILDYSNTNKFKTVRAIGGWDGNGSGYIGLASNLWRSTAAIDRIDFTLPYSTNFGANTTFALYGIKRAGA